MRQWWAWQRNHCKQSPGILVRHRSSSVVGLNATIAAGRWQPGGCVPIMPPHSSSATGAGVWSQCMLRMPAVQLAGVSLTAVSRVWCRAPLDQASVRPPPPLLISLLSHFQFRCNSCGGRVQGEHIDEHLRSGCKEHLAIPHNCLVQPLSTPTTDLEHKVALNVVRRMMLESGDDSITVPTGGKVC